MSKEVVTESGEGFSSESAIREYTLTIDPSGETAPDTIETLLADYAACYVPALRVGGKQRGVDDLGKIQISVTGEVNDDGKLDSIDFDISVETDLDDDTGQQVIDRAFSLCKVHDALKDELHANTTITGGAF